MNEDYLLLLFAILIFGLTLLVLTFRSKNRRKTVIINLVIFVLYSGLFIYNIVYNGKYGSGFLWFFYLACSIGIHWIINVVGIVLTFKRK